MRSYSMDLFVGEIGLSKQVMDDGNDNWEYQPYRCNQGFYYVRYNERTRHFLSVYIYNSHLVMSSGIDQIVFSLLINEHVAC